MPVRDRGQAVVLDGCGPIAALRRSANLVRDHWFRAAGVNALALLLVTLFALGPTFGTSYVLQWVGVTTGFGDQRLFANMLTLLVAAGLGLLSGPFVPIVLTALMRSLRDARDGADLLERLSYLEATPE